MHAGETMHCKSCYNIFQTHQKETMTLIKGTLTLSLLAKSQQLFVKQK